MWCSTRCISCCGRTGTWCVLTHLHKMNVFSWLTLTTMTSLRWWCTIFHTLVLCSLIRISVNIHTFRLNLVQLAASSAWFHWALINISRRIVHKATIVLICWWRWSSHYLLSLLYLQLHLLNLIHMLYLSFTQIALNLLILRCLRWRFLEWSTVRRISICILMRHDVDLEFIWFRVLAGDDWHYTLVGWW